MTKRTSKNSVKAANKASAANLKIILGIIVLVGLALAVASVKFKHDAPQIQPQIAPKQVDRQKPAAQAEPKPLKKPVKTAKAKTIDVNLTELLGVEVRASKFQEEAEFDARLSQFEQSVRDNILSNSAQKNAPLSQENAVNSARKNTASQNTARSKKIAPVPLNSPNSAQDSVNSSLNSAKKGASKKPKLVLIIDDLSSLEQAQNIKATGLRITPSIFPPTSAHPKSANLAKKFDFFMVHLPLEAFHFSANEENTLPANSTRQEIEERIRAVISQFPGLKYINNHTGSKFTSDYGATKILLETLKSHGILFLDSLTTSDSKVKQVCSELGLRYVYRDVFLDNDQDVQKILAQLQKAVNSAKKNGHAIAIGHPYKETFRALNSAKKWLLKEVEIVYLRDVYGLY